MKLIIIKNNIKRINRFVDWLLYMFGYAFVLLIITMIFPKTIYISNIHFGLYYLIASIIIYFLNKTIKPILVILTLPINSLTLGIFYPFINVIILNIVDLILGNYFDIRGWGMSFVVAIFISIMNILLIEVIINQILGKED